VIAHEIGHHVQTVLGISEQVTQASQQDPSRRNELSIRQELQADCLAGVWAKSADTRGALAEQRTRWLRRGFESGNPDACDTFSVPGDEPWREGGCDGRCNGDGAR
jgi:uncharacterized protein